MRVFLLLLLVLAAAGHSDICRAEGIINPQGVTMPSSPYGECSTSDLPLFRGIGTTIDTLMISYQFEGAGAAQFGVEAFNLKEGILRIAFCPDEQQGGGPGRDCYDVKLVMEYTDSLSGGGGGSVPVVRDTVLVQACVASFTTFASPDRLSFGAVAVGSCDTLRFRIRNTGSQLAFVQSYFLDPPTGPFQVQGLGNGQVPIPALDSIEITVIYCPNTVGGKDSLTITISVTGGTLPITVHADGEGRTAAFEMPESVDFGYVNAEDTLCGVVDVIITNQESIPLGLSPTPYGPDLLPFSWELVPLSTDELPRPLIIKPKDSILLRLRFCPDQPIDARDTVFIGQTGQQLILSGRGYVPLERFPAALEWSPGVSVGECSELNDTLNNRNPWPVTVTTEYQGNDNVFRAPVTVQVPAGGIVTVAVQFCPTDALLYTNRKFLLKQGELPEPALELLVSGVGLRPGHLSQTRLDFQEVAVGSCRQDTLVYTNSGSATIFVDAPDIMPDVFRVVEPTEFPVTLRPGGNLNIIVEFCPTEAERYVGSLVFDDAEKVELLGNGSRETRTVRFNTAQAHVGERVRLAMLIERSFTADDLPVEFTVELKYDPRALYLHGAFGPEAVDGSRRQFAAEADGTGNVTIGTNGTPVPLDGDTVLLLEFTGLSTGKPENSVAFVDAEFDIPEPVRLGNDGVVFLIGCDLGRDFEMGNKIFVGAVTPNPTREGTTVIYHAPEGAYPVLHLRDMTGREVLRLELPAGTGTEEAFSLPLGRIAPGFYLLELRDRKERSVVPLILSE